MWPNFVHLFWRIIHGMPVLVSSNWASWLILVGTFFLTEGLLLWREREHMKEWWAKRWGNLALGLLVTGIVYLTLFLWSTVQTIYDEHHDTTGRWQAVVKEKENLKADLKQRDEYIDRLKAITCPACPVNRQARGQQAPETIHDVLAEVRITCILKDSSKMPLDLPIMLPDADSYLEGAGGKAYLQSRAASYKRTEEEGRVVAIENFKLAPNSDLIGIPVSEFAKYSVFHVVDTSVSGGKFSECTFAEVTLRINGRDVFRYGKAIAIKLDETHGLTFNTKLGGMNLTR